MSYAYDKIDRYLRNNLDDADYAEYLAALDALFGAPPAQPAPALTDDEIDKVTCDHFGTQLLPSLLEAHRAYGRAVEAAIVPRWLPIETAPKDGTPVLLYFTQDDSDYFCGDPITAFYNGSGWTGCDSGEDIDLVPSHWMPLPLPPKDAP